MVAFSYLGEDDMSDMVRRRRKRRQKITETTLYLLDQQDWRFSDLFYLVQKSTKSRLSRQGLGIIMRPYFVNGTIISERVSDHGVETHIWRKP